MIFKVRAAVKPVVFVAGLLPLAYVVWQVWQAAQGLPNELGADPAKAVVWFTGIWALRFMLLALSVTPLRRITGWSSLARLRRMLGLYAFFYAVVHFAAYSVLLLELQFSEIGREIISRPFILVGFVALCGLLPLALTSNRFMISRLKQRWRALHRLVYPIAGLQIIHFFWLTRSDYTEPLMYSAALAWLMGYRVYILRQSKALRTTRTAAV